MKSMTVATTPDSPRTGPDWSDKKGKGKGKHGCSNKSERDGCSDKNKSERDGCSDKNKSEYITQLETKILQLELEVNVKGESADAEIKKNQQFEFNMAKLQADSKAQLEEHLEKISHLEDQFQQKRELEAKVAKLDAELERNQTYVSDLKSQNQNQAKEISNQARELSDRRDRDHQMSQMEIERKQNKEAVETLRSDNARLLKDKQDTTRLYDQEYNLRGQLQEQVHRLTGKHCPKNGQAEMKAPDDSEEDFEEYDMTLDITSLKQICRDKQVKLFQSLTSIFEFGKMQRLKIVAVLGLFDKGKSFLINKLFKKNLPHGKLHTTLGLRFLYLKEEKTLVIDSQGVQATVSYNADECTGGIDPTVDAQMTESLVFAVISELAHHVIFVCNDLTWNEQKYLQMLGNSDKSLVIAVHNMQTTICGDEASELFDKQIARCYRGDYVIQRKNQTEEDADMLFYASEGRDKKEILHVGIAKEGTQAGELYNQKAYDKIMHRMDHAKSLIGETMRLSEKIAQVLNKFLPVHLRLQTRSGEKLQKSKLVEVEVEEAVGVKEEHSKYGKKVAGFTLAASHEILTFHAVGVTDSLGMVMYYQNNFEPLVNEFTMMEDGTEIRYLTIEATGVDPKDIKVEEQAGGRVAISMFKHKNIDETRATPYSEDEKCKNPAPIRQTDGPFFKVINLLRHETTHPLWTHENGMFVMKMTLKQPKAREELTEIDFLQMELSDKIKEQAILAGHGHRVPAVDDRILQLRIQISELTNAERMKALSQDFSELEDPPESPPTPPTDRTAQEAEMRIISDYWTRNAMSAGKKVYDSSSDREISKLAEDLRKAPPGTIFVVPTDTVYCLAARAHDEAGIANLYNIKGRSQKKPVSFWLSKSYVDNSLSEEMFSPKLWKAMNKSWPGKTSFVVNKGSHLDKLFPEWRTSRCGTVDKPGRANSIALRVPDCAVLNRLMDLAGPLAVTSANPSGGRDVDDWMKTLDMIKDKHYVLGVMAGRVANSFGETGEMASSVIDVKDWEECDQGDYMDDHICGSEVTVPKFLRKGVNFDSIYEELKTIFEVTPEILPSCELH